MTELVTFLAVFFSLTNKIGACEQVLEPHGETLDDVVQLLFQHCRRS